MTRAEGFCTLKGRSLATGLKLRRSLSLGQMDMTVRHRLWLPLFAALFVIGSPGP
jgi:hypothetical protein